MKFRLIESVSSKIKDPNTLKQIKQDIQDFKISKQTINAIESIIPGFSKASKEVKQEFWNSLANDGLKKEGTFADFLLTYKFPDKNDRMIQESGFNITPSTVTVSKLNTLRKIWKSRPDKLEAIYSHPELYLVDDKDFNQYLNFTYKYPDAGLVNPKNNKIYSLDTLRSQNVTKTEKKSQEQENQDEFSKATTHEQEKEVVKKILSQPKYKQIAGIHDVLAQSILDLGATEGKNGFLKLANKLNFSMPKAREFKQKALYLYGGYKNKRIDLTHEYLINPTLWNRSDNDFNKAVNAFEICMSPKYAKNYLKDTSVIDINEFFNGDTIKPTKDILNVVDSWAKGNEYSEDERAQRGATGSTLLNLIGERKWNKDTFISAINQALANTDKFKMKHNRDFYESIINDLFVLPEALSNLDDIKGTSNLITNDEAKGFIKDGKINAAACIKASQYGKTDSPVVVSIPAVNEIYLYYEGKVVKLLDSEDKLQTSEINKLLGKVDNQMSELENYPAPSKDKITNQDETIQLIVSALDDLEDKNIV